ncbi:MAG: GNAT family N-acetyltransferase [Limnohabitans sp.]
MDAIAPEVWDGLLHMQATPTPFMRHAYLQAMSASGSAVPSSGWALRLLTLWQGQALAAACPVWLKGHSRGEYVFDWAWAEAYQRHGLAYYPKAIVASPFTPVPGSRLLARSLAERAALVQAVTGWCAREGLPSLHILFGDETDQRSCAQAGLMLRQQVQFHWKNAGWRDFEDFLASLNQQKRKKIRQERRKVREAGVVVRTVLGGQASAADWAFVQQCYQQTYWEHGNPPYLQPGFFEAMRRDMPDNWVIFIGEREGQPMAMSLIGLQRDAQGAPQVAYGRYWGATQRVDCLHFEACYYQPIEWCLAHAVQRFEGGAQGEHKMARALLPVNTASAHWIAHPAFAEAIARFLERESEGVTQYLEVLGQHSPLRQAQA